jgi:phosphate-selective porin OprO and OprP
MNCAAIGRWALLSLSLSISVALMPTRVLAQTAGTSPSATDLEKRVRELEETVRRLQGERKPTNAYATPALNTNATPASVPAKVTQASAAPPSNATAPSVEVIGIGDGATPAGKEDGGPRPNVFLGWDDGFYLRSEDKKYSLRITGQIQADYRTYLDDVDNTDIDTFLVRRARFGLEANMFQYYEFRLLPDFGQGPAVVQDAYLNVHYWDAFQVEAGKFKQPFSYEQLIQDRFVPTLERSLIDQLVPQRDVGLMLHGQKLLGNRLDYAVSVSNGEINGNGDTNDLKDLAGRVAVRPLNDERLLPIVRGFQIGISGSTGKEQEPMNPNTLRTPANVPFFQFNPGVRADGLRNRWSPEVSYFYRSFGFAAQYFEQVQDLRPSFVGPTFRFEQDIPFRGWYVLATYLLTGEERTTYSEPVIPCRPFDPCHPFHCYGAWELVSRVSRLRVGDAVFAPGPAQLANPALYSPGVTELTLGFNWYFNKWVRMQFDWEHDWFDDPVQLGPGSAGRLRHQDSLLTRFQVIF